MMNILNVDLCDEQTNAVLYALAQALIRSTLDHCMDYCNILFAGLPAGHISRLQSLLRAAA